MCNKDIWIKINFLLFIIYAVLNIIVIFSVFYDSKIIKFKTPWVINIYIKKLVKLYIPQMREGRREGEEEWEGEGERVLFLLSMIAKNIFLLEYYVAYVRGNKYFNIKIILVSQLNGSHLICS